MEILEQLTVNIPTPIIPPPTESPEINLDDLLAESIAHSQISPHRKLIDKLKTGLQAINAVPWITVDYIAVWRMDKCTCGHVGTITFVRYMRKRVRKNAKNEKHWETIPDLSSKPLDTKHRNTLITTDVISCEYCMNVDYLNLENFNKVVE